MPQAPQEAPQEAPQKAPPIPPAIPTAAPQVVPIAAPPATPIAAPATPQQPQQLKQLHTHTPPEPAVPSVEQGPRYSKEVATIAEIYTDNKLFMACQGVPACKIAVSNSREDLSQLINKLQPSIATGKKEHPSQRVYTTLSTDRRHHNQDQAPSAQAPSTQAPSVQAPSVQAPSGQAPSATFLADLPRRKLCQQHAYKASALPILCPLESAGACGSYKPSMA